MMIASRLGMPRSLRARLLASFLILSLVPLLAVSGLSYQQSQAAVRAEAASELGLAAKAQGAAFTNWMNTRVAEVQVLADTDAVRSLEPDRMAPYVTSMKNRYGVYEGIF